MLAYITVKVMPLILYIYVRLSMKAIYVTRSACWLPSVSACARSGVYACVYVCVYMSYQRGPIRRRIL